MYLGLKLLDLVLQKIKNSENINIFKWNNKFWKPENCLCRLWKLYLPQIMVLWHFYLF